MRTTVVLGPNTTPAQRFAVASVYFDMAARCARAGLVDVAARRAARAHRVARSLDAAARARLGQRYQRALRGKA